MLVIGGGVCGIQAALDLADMGFRVYLVEKEASIGGHMAQLDKTFPTLDCSLCILAPKMVEASRHPNIILLTWSEVKKVQRTSNGSAFRVRILRKPRYVDEKKCTGCRLCVEKCPVKVQNEFEERLSLRKAIYIPFPQALPAVTVVDKEHCLYLTKGVCRICEKFCPSGALDFEQTPQEMEVGVGAIIVATGFEVFNARSKSEYGYGRYPNVITGLGLERLLSASGPTGGQLLRLSDGRIPSKIAFIQCVGSRDERTGNLNCSRVCCMYATKQAVLSKEHVQGVDVALFYTDLRAYGKGFEELYRRAEKEFGIRFVRGLVSEVIEESETKSLVLRVEDTDTGELLEEEFDMVVLSTGLMPPGDSKTLGETLDIPRGVDGFFTSSDPELSSVVTPSKGVFIAGVAEGPKDISESVSQASAAAMKASIETTKNDRCRF